MQDKIIRFIAVIFLFCCLQLTIQGQTAQQAIITNDTKVTFVGDSFFFSQYGQRYNFVMGSFFINYYPQYFVSWRDFSRSGQNNVGFNTEEFAEYVTADAGSCYGKTNDLFFVLTSSNGSFSSNAIYTNIVISLTFPGSNYNQNVILTNDWSQPNEQFLYKFSIVGDAPYHKPGGGSSYTYSDGGKTAAIEADAPFIDSFRNLSNAVLSFNGGYPANSNLWFFNGGAYDHNGNIIQGAWAMTSLINPTNGGGLGVDTNTFTFIINAATATISLTNHCIISGLTGNSSHLSFTFHADRMAPGYWMPDGVTTNDMRGMFDLIPSLTNSFCEIMKIPNLIPGNYLITWDGTNKYIRTASQLAVGDNLFANYSCSLWPQKMLILYDLCDMMDVSHVDAAADQHPGDNRHIERFRSNANSLWPLNTSGVDAYIAEMQTFETDLIGQDIVIHNDAQQINHSITITRILDVQFNNATLKNITLK